MTEPLIITLKTLTPLWTGGADGRSDRLHTTGIIGSLRWWYEAIVRGLGGRACDPTSDERCPGADGQRCTVCELFGCTGWARKFRFRVLDENEQVIQTAIGKNVTVVMQFVQARPICDAEKWLLAQSVYMMATHGSMGGKTTLKPQSKSGVGDDFGLVSLQEQFSLSTNRETVVQYLSDTRWCNPQILLPDLRWFFFVRGNFLYRRQINSLIGLSEDGKSETGNVAYQKFLRGQRGDGHDKPAISKKIFSFRADGGRVWGYAHDQAMRDEIIIQLHKELGEGHYMTKTGEEVLNGL